MKKLLTLILAIAITLAVFPAMAQEAQLHALCDSPLMTGPGYTEEYVEIDFVSEGSTLPYKGVSFGADGSMWYYTAYYGIAGYVLADHMELITPEPELDKDSQERLAAQARTLSAGYSFTVAIRNDGTAVGAGDNSYGQLNFGGWTDLVSISAGGYHTVGLKSDGTVVAVGMNQDGQCDVSHWNDIVAISAGKFHTVGLRSDGTVLAVGSNDKDQCDVSGWKDVRMIAAGSTFTVAVCKDGRAVATGLYDVSSYSAGTPSNDVRFWPSTLQFIDANQTMMGGVTAEGTVVLDGYSRYTINYENSVNIKEIAIGGAHVLFLQQRGVVFAFGANGNNQCSLLFWDDIAAIDAGALFSVALRNDGTVIAMGNNDYGQCNVEMLTDIRVP